MFNKASLVDAFPECIVTLEQVKATHVAGGVVPGRTWRLAGDDVPDAIRRKVMNSCAKMQRSTSWCLFIGKKMVTSRCFLLTHFQLLLEGLAAGVGVLAIGIVLLFDILDTIIYNTTSAKDQAPVL